MRLVYIRWKDAVLEQDDHTGEAKAQVADLEEVGWLIDENEEAVLIGMEKVPANMQAGRARLHIPRRNITEMRVAEFVKAFPAKSVVWRS